ncbi:MAG: hypothetical protein CML44_02910 [Rhodobacteraceae bacterium]|nr:hypothetical protein [Paracoccaceae bacterium]|tara:strand:+ start:269 stop:1819 length:1551 start_codon:yes stop_codon:yes gene_type:complete
MIDPVYTTTLIVGGSTHKYAFSALPTEILADQSMDLSITILNSDSSPYDLSGATAEFYCTARNVTGLVPTALGSATLSDSGSGTVDTVSIVLPKDGIPDFLGEYTPTRTGSSVFYFQIQDADSYIQIYQYVNVTASDFSGNGSGNIELPSSSLAYDPSDPANWVDPDPTTVSGGLDTLADRVQVIEDNPATGDMQKSTYDPQLIESDTFDRTNHTGTQDSTTISDFDSAVSANANVSGSVTVHSDVSDAGSGQIITNTERANISTSFAHVSSSTNPHNVTPLQVGSTTPQWYASHIQTTPIDDPSLATDQYVATWDSTTSSVKWVAPSGPIGGGQSNDLVLDAGATGEDIRVTKTGSDIITKGILGTGVLSTSTNGSDIEVDLPASTEGVVGGVAIASFADINSGTADVAIDAEKLKTTLESYQTNTASSKTTSGAYTLIASDVGKDLYIDNALTIPVLTTDFNVTIRNDSNSAVGITLSGTVAKNNSDTQISAFGTIAILYQSSTDVWIDGNTEA